MTTKPVSSIRQQHRQMARHFWRLLPIGIAIAVLLIAFTIERLLVQQEQRHLQRTIEVSAVAIKNEIQSHLSNDLLSLAHIAKRIENNGDYNRGEWETEAQLYLEHFTGYEALAWFRGHQNGEFYIIDNAASGRTGTINWQSRLIRETVQKQTLSISPAFHLNDDAHATLISIPLSREQQGHDAVIGLFRTQDLLQAIVRKKIAPDYDLQIIQGHEAPFHYSAIGGDHDAETPLPTPGNWTQQSTLSLPGVTWTLQVTPTAETLEELQSLLVHIPLLGGPIIALLLIFMLGFARKSREASSQLVSANQELRQKVDKLEVAESLIHKLSHAVEENVSAIVLSNNEGQLEYVNKCFSHMTGYDFAEVEGKTLAELNPMQLSQNSYLEMLHTVAMGGTWEGEIYNQRKTGEPYWEFVSASPIREPDGEISHFMFVHHDISEKKRYEKQLEHQKHHDLLTGLPNRTMMLDRLTQAMAFGRRYNRLVCVMFLGIDNFRYINDSVGHSGGDLLLRQVAERLIKCTRSNDTVSRHGGDEFIMVLTDIGDAQDIEGIVEKVRTCVARPFTILARQYTISITLGTSLFPSDDDNAESLLIKANTAQITAKRERKGSYLPFSKVMGSAINERIALEKELHTAIERDQLMLHYQPQIDIWSGKIVGVEALLRWNHPEHGPIPPNRFLPIAEETGLIVSIGEWVIRHACAQLKAWQASGLPAIGMAVNVSAHQFSHQDVAGIIEAALAENSIDPNQFELELTESLLLHDVERTTTTLNRLKGLGVSIAIDDFGTGYSSLGYLRLFPIDKLKIDRLFIRDIPHKGAAAIARTIISMARALDLSVLAEGVETEAQLAFLRQHACDEYQGFFFSKPLPAEELARLLRDDQQSTDSRTC